MWYIILYVQYVEPYTLGKRDEQYRITSKRAPNYGETDSI